MIAYAKKELLFPFPVYTLRKMERLFLYQQIRNLFPFICGTQRSSLGKNEHLD